MAEFLFTCAICERDICTWAFNRGTNMQVAPVCQYCEKEYGGRPPEAGAFKDRRKAVQISALAEALHSQASCMAWEARHARA